MILCDFDCSRKFHKYNKLNICRTAEDCIIKIYFLILWWKRECCLFITLHYFCSHFTYVQKRKYNNTKVVLLQISITTAIQRTVKVTREFKIHRKKKTFNIKRIKNYTGKMKKKKAEVRNKIVCIVRMTKKILMPLSCGNQFGSKLLLRDENNVLY